jgi:peptide chain release factor 1
MDYLQKQKEKIEKKIEEARKMLDDPNMAELAGEEISRLEKQKEQLQATVSEETNLQSTKAAILEIRAAAGGDEAGLFAADLYRMYTRYTEKAGWNTEQLSVSSGGIGNIKEVVFRIVGDNVFDRLKFESGVHRVQRVPKTESSGRIHTSTATVAVLPEISDREFHLDPKDLKVETYRASGHGGQNVQKVETAVRITHLPTNTAATCQSERSQFQNKDQALSILRSRLYERQRKAGKEKIDTERKIQVGAGERAEKIRTYNFPQNRVTDHRVNRSWHNLENIMDGGLDKITSSLSDVESAK